MKNAIWTIYFAIGVLSAQTRPWGFNKDTVYETIIGSGNPIVDTLTIFNNSPDTLYFDTATVELVYPPIQNPSIYLSIENEISGPLISLFRQMMGSLHLE